MSVYEDNEENGPDDVLSPCKYKVLYLKLTTTSQHYVRYF